MKAEFPTNHVCETVYSSETRKYKFIQDSFCRRIWIPHIRCVRK